MPRLSEGKGGDAELKGETCPVKDLRTRSPGPSLWPLTPRPGSFLSLAFVPFSNETSHCPPASFAYQTLPLLNLEGP